MYISPLQVQQFRTGLKKMVDFTDDEWSIVEEHLYLRRFKKKDLFISYEKVCSEIGFILSGSFRIFLLKDGIEWSNYFLFQNELISSYRSFLIRTESGISIEAMEDAQLVCLSHAAWQTLLSHTQLSLKMERLGRLIAEYLICCYEERVLSLITQSPEQRYQSMLEQQPGFLQKVPQHYLANYLGITPVSLSRIRKRILASAASQKKAS